MRYETKAGLGPPMRHNDHASKALGYLLGGPHGKLAQEQAISNTIAVSYLQASRRDADVASYIN